MDYETFYGEAYVRLKKTEQRLRQVTEQYCKECGDGSDSCIEHCKSRIKSPESMERKLKKRGIPVTPSAALECVNDAVGIRIICAFIDDIYTLSEWIQSREDIEVLKIKDYIAYPKKNGYRSRHMILRFRNGAEAGLNAEIQLRTIAQDFWASLEHQIKYKKQIEHEQMIRSELKRCADEIASIDFSMQTIRELIREAEPYQNNE